LSFSERWHVVVRLLKYMIFIWLLLAAQLAYGQNTVIYQDDFEGPVSGWSVNNTEFDPDVTRFLGRFDNNPDETSRTFTVPAGATQLVIEFDFYRFDSWDNNATFGFDRFEIDIDGGQIFSLPFSNPQAARFGTSGNVDWNHSPLTGRVELAFNSGQFWFDQLHRVEIIVNNPGPTVDLTLRTALNQGGNDESGGFDNFLVTAIVPPPTEITANLESFPPIESTSGGATTSVLASDTFDNLPATLSDVTLTQLSSSSPDVALDPVTGFISVAPGTPAGDYLLEYEICEIGEPANCSTVTETITVIPSSPSLAMTKVAGAPGPYQAGDVVTYTYTVTNDGDTIIRDIAINDTHNGSGPAPSPANELLSADNGTAGDSTDAAPDGSWDILAPGDVITFTGTYTVTQMDVDTL